MINTTFQNQLVRLAVRISYKDGYVSSVLQCEIDGVSLNSSFSRSNQNFGQSTRLSFISYDTILEKHKRFEHHSKSIGDHEMRSSRYKDP